MVQNRKPEKSNELWDAHPDPSLIRHRSQASFSILRTYGNNNHTVVIKKSPSYHCSCSKCMSQGLALSGTPVRRLRRRLQDACKLQVPPRSHSEKICNPGFSWAVCESLNQITSLLQEVKWGCFPGLGQQ